MPSSSPQDCNESNLTLNLEALRAGDEVAWSDAFEILYPVAFAAALRNLNDRADAEDVASRVLTAFYRQRPEVVGETHARAWCAAVGEKMAKSAVRKKMAAKRGWGLVGWLDAVASKDLPVTVPDDKVAQVEQVAEYLKQLPERERQILVSVVANGEKPKEVGEKWGLASSTINGLVRKSLEHLRRLNGDFPTGPSAAMLIFAIVRMTAWLAPAFTISI